jgi:hypothetical protein
MLEKKGEKNTSIHSNGSSQCFYFFIISHVLGIFYSIWNFLEKSHILKVLKLTPIRIRGNDADPTDPNPYPDTGGKYKNLNL